MLVGMLPAWWLVTLALGPGPAHAAPIVQRPSTPSDEAPAAEAVDDGIEAPPTATTDDTTETAETAGTLEMHVERPHSNVIDAAAGGAADGMKLALNVAAMLLAFLALVAMINYVVELPTLWHNRDVWADVLRALHRAHAPVPEGCADPTGAAAYQACIDQVVQSGVVHGDFASWTPWSLQRVLGYLFWPIAFVMGVPIEDCSGVASLLGEKLILNEFVAYVHLAGQISGVDGAHTARRSALLVQFVKNRKRFAPETLAAEEPVAKLVIDRLATQAVFGEPESNFFFELRSRQTVELPRVDGSAVIGVDLLADKYRGSFVRRN